MFSLVDTCGKQFHRRATILDHFGSHTGRPRHVCLTCGEKFVHRMSLVRHREGQRCGKKRPTASKANTEEKSEPKPRSERRSKTKFYKITPHCGICDRYFPTCAEVKTHPCEFKLPGVPKRVICRVCKKVVMRASFYQHINIHGGKRVCSVCGKTFAGQQTLSGEL